MILEMLSQKNKKIVTLGLEVKYIDKKATSCEEILKDLKFKRLKLINIYFYQ